MMDRKDQLTMSFALMYGDQRHQSEHSLKHHTEKFLKSGTFTSTEGFAGLERRVMAHRYDVCIGESNLPPEADIIINLMRPENDPLAHTKFVVLKRRNKK